jgi:putative holliday junction resolvase
VSGVHVSRITSYAPFFREAMRILSIDPGEKKIGLAISDPEGLIARPLTGLTHVSRQEDAARIVALATEYNAEMILLGLALDAEGHTGPQARRAERLAEALRQLTPLPINLYDESHSTQTAQAALIAAGKKRRARREQIHAAAAAALLQSYLDARTSK